MPALAGISKQIFMFTLMAFNARKSVGKYTAVKILIYYLQEHGSKTYIELQKDKTYEFKIIIGLVSIDENFIGVENIIRKNDRYISIVGKNGKTIDVPCRVDFV